MTLEIQCSFDNLSFYPFFFAALNAQHGFGLLSAGAAASSRQNFPAVGPLGK